MFAYCTIDGLTVSGKLWKVGDLFILPPNLLKEVEGKSDEQIARWQKKTWKKSIFRRPTGEELAIAYNNKKIKLTECDEKEKAVIGRILMSDAERRKRAAAVLMGDSSIDVDIEDELVVAAKSRVDESPVEKK
jgi:hypothetical protein